MMRLTPIIIRVLNTTAVRRRDFKGEIVNRWPVLRAPRALPVPDAVLRTAEYKQALYRHNAMVAPYNEALEWGRRNRRKAEVVDLAA